MTTYTAAVTTGGTSYAGMLVATYTVRIARIENANASTTGIAAYKGAAASIPGGTSVVAGPTRQGAPLSACSFKSGATAPSLGSLSLIGSRPSGDYEPTFDLLLLPGTVIYIAGGGNYYFHYEEQRNLSWSY